MKKSFLFKFLILFVALLIFLGVYRFKTSPKKVVASAINGLDHTFYKKIDEFVPELGINEIIDKMENEGTFTLSLLINGDGKYKNIKDNLIYIYDPQNDKFAINTFSKSLKFNYSYNLKKINNEIFFKVPSVSKDTFYFDQNTMKQFSTNSSAFSDLGLEDFHLLNSVETLNDLKYDFKNYVKEEWSHVLNSIRIKELYENNYEIRLKSKDLYSLLDKSILYLKNKDSFFLSLVPMNELYKLRDMFKNNREIILYLKTHKNSNNMLSFESIDGDYKFEINDEFDLKIKDLDLNLKFQKLEDRNSILGRLNNRDFKITYVPKSQRLYYRDENYYSITEFTKISKNDFFNSKTIVNGSDRYKNVYFNFYTAAKEIKKENEYVEVLKLNQKEWNEVKSNFSESLDLKRYFR